MNLADHVKTARPLAKLKQGRADWYSLKASVATEAGPTAELYIYDEIGYWGVTATDLINELKNITDSAISVRLNTPGGDVFDGIAIMNALKAHPAAVHVTVDSLAASIGSVIAMAGDTIIMAPNSQMMIHNAHGVVIGNANDMREFAALLDKQDANLASIYQARAGGRSDSWRNAMKAETWYSAEEAVDAGLADKVGTFSLQTSNDWDLSIYNYAGREQAPAPQTPDSPEPVFQFDPDLFRATMKEAAGR